MKPIESREQLKVEAEAVGYGMLDDDELDFLKRWYDRAYELCAQLRGVDTSGEEPATVFNAATPS